MKILLLIDSLGSGGAQRQMVTLAKLFAGKGYTIHFLVYHQEDFFKDELDKINIPVFIIRSNNYLARVFKVRKFIRNGNYKVVVSFLEVPNFLNCISAIGKRSWKVITSERSSNERNFKSFRGRVFRWFQKYSDAIVCNSHHAKDIWDDQYPGYRQKLSVIYNPVILKESNVLYTPRRNGKLNIVIAASYQYLKNPIGLIDAVTLLSEEERKRFNIDWYGEIEVASGDTKAYDESMKKLKDKGLEGVIHLHPPVKNIIDKMTAADAIALFSSVEGLPNAICEGMMIGKPIIMSRVSDFDVLVDESNGYLCDWDNLVSIKDALLRAGNLSVSELDEMGKTSKIKATNLFDPEKILSEWMRLIS